MPFDLFCTSSIHRYSSVVLQWQLTLASSSSWRDSSASPGSVRTVCTASIAHNFPHKECSWSAISYEDKSTWWRSVGRWRWYHTGTAAWSRATDSCRGTQNLPTPQGGEASASYHRSREELLTPNGTSGSLSFIGSLRLPALRFTSEQAVICRFRAFKFSLLLHISNFRGMTA